MQDAGSQAISEFLEVEPGMRVIDACAGGGGKSLHLSALMQNKGRIISMDVTQWKLDAVWLSLFLWFFMHAPKLLYYTLRKWFLKQKPLIYQDKINH